jgi:NADH-quinone oxidoreductase subunit N
MVLCLLSLTGIPPTAGFVGRLYLFSAAARAGLLWLAIVGALNSVVSLACVWRIARALFVVPPAATPPEAVPPADEAAQTHLAVSPVLAIVLGVCAIGTLAMAVLADPILIVLETAAQALLG